MSTSQLRLPAESTINRLPLQSFPGTYFSIFEIGLLIFDPEMTGGFHGDTTVLSGLIESGRTTRAQ